MQKTPEGRKDYSDGAILSIKAAKGDACPKRCNVVLLRIYNLGEQNAHVGPTD
jgi:hypothetical protein